MRGKGEVRCKAPVDLGVRNSLARSPGSGERKGREEVRGVGGGKPECKKNKVERRKRKQREREDEKEREGGEARSGTGEAESGAPPGSVAEPGGRSGSRLGALGSRRSGRGTPRAADPSFRGEGQGAGEGRRDSSGNQG